MKAKEAHQKYDSQSWFKENPQDLVQQLLHIIGKGKGIRRYMVVLPHVGSTAKDSGVLKILNEVLERLGQGISQYMVPWWQVPRRTWCQGFGCTC